MVLLATSALAACAGGMSGIPRVASTAAETRSVTPMSNPCAQAPDSVGVVGVTTTSSCQDCQTSGTCQTCPNGSQADGCAIGAPGPPPGWNNCVIGCNPANPGDPINVGPPCKPVSSCIAFDATCPGALAENTTTDGTNQHDSQISNVLSFWFDQPSGNYELAYEYQTYGGQEYIQFNYTISVAIGPISVGASMGPLYHMNGSWFATLQSVLSDVHKTTKDLPWPYNALGEDSAHELQCAQKNQG